MILSTVAAPSSSSAAPEKKSVISTAFEIIGAIFKPVLSIIIGAGILQALRDVLVMTGAISKVSSSYILLNAMGDCVFYFLPIFLAFSCAKVFNASPYMAAAIASFLVYPTVTELYNWTAAVGWNLTIFHVVPISYSKFPSSVLPIILIVYAQSWIEKGVQKIIPNLLKTIFVPVLTLFCTAFLALTVLGPIGTWIGDGMAWIITWLNTVVPWFVPTLIGAIAPLMVLTGSHYSLFPVATQNLSLLGYDTVMLPGNLASNIALAGVSFAVAMRAKSQQFKSYCSSSGITAFFGITQSALYGIAIPLKKPLYAAMFGGGIAGLWAGITKVRCYSFVTPGLLSVVSYITPDSMANLINAIIMIVIAFVAGFVATVALGFEEPSDASVSEIAGETTKEKAAEAREQLESLKAQVAETEAVASETETRVESIETAVESKAIAEFIGLAKPEDDKTEEPEDTEETDTPDSKE